MTVNNTKDSNVYFKKTNNNYNISLAVSGSLTYYVAFWIEEISGEQNADQSKTYSCRFGFEGVNGANLSAEFDV